MNINQAIEAKILEKIEVDDDLVKKEFGESEYDFEKAYKAFDEQDYK